MCSALFLKHKLSRADFTIMFCYSLSVLLMVKVSDGQSLEGFHQSFRIFRQFFFLFFPNEKLVEK